MINTVSKENNVDNFCLSVHHGNFSYDHKRQVLNDINFQVNSGDLLAILGPNGAGKTTMLRCIMGFMKWQNGESQLNGKNIASIPLSQALATTGLCSSGKKYSNCIQCTGYDSARTKQSSWDVRSSEEKGSGNG